jgi:hypothetical protein
VLRGKFADAIEEVASACRELGMLKQAGRPQPPRPRAPEGDERKAPSVTMVDRDPRTGELRMTHSNKIGLKREELRHGVFRPGWNLPTMTLEEQGEIE